MSDHCYFADWCDKASEWCELACDLRPDRVPIWYFAELFARRMSPEEAGALLAKAIS